MYRAGASAAEGDRNHHNKGNPKKSSSKPPDKWYKKGKVHDLQEMDSATDDDEFYVNTVDSTVEERKEILQESRPKSQREVYTAVMKIKCNKITKNNKIVNASFVRQSNTKLIGYSGEPIRHSVSVVFECGKAKLPLKFFLVDTDGPNILGLQGCRALDLIKINCHIQHTKPIKDVQDLQSIYPTQFDQIGNFEGTFRIRIDTDASPVVHPPRKYPVNILKELEGELKRMEQLGVIRKENEPTDWVNSLAFSRKANGKLRICLDPKDLN
ncbi:transposon Ty3-I Gag-Pol polyprotein [Elysia marginata]|uniref:Transposon Ty3-I Gag-Pol polyprotein n=1 Tax=Elysia marginata TaxID=1093978 RepID=A0AAV4HBP1_9GAST|nr:transposon Ty3-I Gag-Pol polyprotein [Elysia marginata]